ncbi:uncharacterized protein UV8b_07171 [Ustilaginoidea virens]|uniref:Aminoglycoside phosphotransferase domain-containing protein n=1 Tax=Ustilaginoidea virens TaxID=1159556 RepID=A0A8E5HWJ3_USTVR|nr:uncharacterized protein UV8b_07171 [Ustilaginoidea virens]QUC22930.1 hypothetical protein UV8b_07171 [Ustilaginoidea virens]
MSWLITSAQTPQKFPFLLRTTGTPSSRVCFLRFPLSSCVGDAASPGNSNEKVNCEAATYAWLQENCPLVPIPKLYGFGLSTDPRVSAVARTRLADLDIGYVLIQTITSGEMLPESWDEKRDDVRLQQNLQRDLASIILSLASIRQPRIGSFRLDGKGYRHLDNRPLNLEAFDDRRLHQPNAVESRDDAWYQMSSLAAAEIVFPQLFQKKLVNGPFALCLTHLHRSNIFVDDNWNPPYWLSGKLVDEIEPAEDAPVHAKFLQRLRDEEQIQNHTRNAEPLSSTMQEAWIYGSFWVTLAVMDPVGFTSVFYDRILPEHFSFSPEELTKADYHFFARFWRRDISSIIDKKQHDRSEYSEEGLC